MSLTLISKLLLPFLLLFCFAKLTMAQGPEFVLQSSVEYAFGEELQLSLDVENSSDIKKIILSLRPTLSHNWYVMDVPFEPGETISVTHSIDVNDLNILPYSRVNYFLEVQTSDGTMYKSPEEGFNYEDSRFAWQKMSQDGVTVHWTGISPFFGQDIINVVNESLSRLAVILPMEHINPFQVYVYPSSADLRDGLLLAGLNGENFSHPELDVILVTAVNSQTALTELGQSIPNELSRLMLYQIAGDDVENMPWWLSEGLGTFVQSESNPRHQQLLEDAINAGETIPIEQLCQKTERAGDRDLLSLAQSSSLVSYIIEMYGDDVMADLVSSYIRGDDCETGVDRVLGLSLRKLDEAWKDGQQQPSVISQLITDYGLWLILLLAGTVFMIFLILQTWQGKRTDSK